MNKLIYLVALLLAACGGGGGGNTGSSTKLSTTSDVTCTLKTYSSNYPNSFLGYNLIPTPNQQFDSNVIRSIGLKDYHPLDNNNCNSNSDYTRLLYKRTLDRLQMLGVDTVEIYQYGPVDDFNATTWTINENNWQIPKSELIWFFQEAHSRNIKVTLVWQLWSVDSKGNNINTSNINQTDLVKLLRGWKDIMMTMARISGQNNVDNLYIQWSAFYYPEITKYSETATQEFVSIIDDIKSVFKGKLLMGTVGGLFFDKRVIEKVDAIVVPLVPSNWSYIDDSNISVPLLKQRFSDSIDGIYLEFSLKSGMDTKNIPIIWDFNIQSRDKALSQGWVEDGFCITILGGSPIQWGNPSCMQTNYVTDFSIQALAIEGAFQAIKQQTYFKTYGINFSTGYWHTDTLTPGPEGFPNLSQSIRGKPAETIVKAWYKK